MAQTLTVVTELMAIRISRMLRDFKDSVGCYVTFMAGRVMPSELVF